MYTIIKLYIYIYFNRFALIFGMLIPSDQPAVALGQVAQLDQALQGARAKEVQLTQEMQERSSAYRSWKKTAVLDMSQHVSAFKTLDRIVLLCNVDWVLVQLFNAVCQLSLHFSKALTVLEVINGSSEPLGIAGSFGGSQTSPKRTEGLGGAWGTAPAQWLHIAPCGSPFWWGRYLWCTAARTKSGGPACQGRTSQRRSLNCCRSHVEEFLMRLRLLPGSGKKPRLGRSSTKDGGGEPEACR